MRKQYNKLIRDNIPTIMDLQDKKFKVHIATEKEYQQKLQEKLLEEVTEFLENPCIEELADIQEVLNALLYNMHFDDQKLLQEMLVKSVTNGTFNKKLILEWVEV